MLSSLLVVFKVLVLDPNRQRPCCKLKVMPPKLVVAVASDLWTGLLFLQLSPAWPPAPWLQQYVVLHQVGWWASPSLFHLGSILPLSLLAAPAPPEWSDLFRLATSALRLLTPPCRFFMAVYSAMLYASLVERRLAYSTTCLFRVLFAVVRFLTAVRSSDVACARLANVMHMSMTFLALPVLCPPCWEVCCSLRRSTCA